MLAIHPQARTTPVVRAEIARSHEASGVKAKRYGVSTETKIATTSRKRYLYVAIDRASGYVHLAVREVGPRPRQWAF